MDEASQIIQSLKLKAHPEGGYYRETYRHNAQVTSGTKTRNLATSIYYLLRGKEISKLHRLTSDEIWYYHAGECAIIHCFTSDKEYQKIVLGPCGDNAIYQVVIPAGTIFGAEVHHHKDYFLAGCMVSPGFDFEDFKFIDKAVLEQSFPDYRKIINTFT